MKLSLQKAFAVLASIVTPFAIQAALEIANQELSTWMSPRRPFSLVDVLMMKVGGWAPVVSAFVGFGFLVRALGSIALYVAVVYFPLMYALLLIVSSAVAGIYGRFL